MDVPITHGSSSEDGEHRGKECCERWIHFHNSHLHDAHKRKQSRSWPGICHELNNNLRRVFFESGNCPKSLSGAQRQSAQGKKA